MIDPDLWIEMANSATELPAAGPAGFDDRPDVDDLTDRLLHVLDDESASMVPPTARNLSYEEWQRTPPRARARLIRRHLASLDPRLLPRTVEVWSGRRLRQHHR